MWKSIQDMDGGNGDLLKVMALQFNNAYRLQANAWIYSTHLPVQMKKEVKFLPQLASLRMIEYYVVVFICCVGQNPTCPSPEG